ncbi:hypothetical protein IFO70_27355 [Phormidium tenue FACHB-886]|nr:hypothetical protein [Phormidium tenue FACHB-886]
MIVLSQLADANSADLSGVSVAVDVAQILGFPSYPIAADSDPVAVIPAQAEVISGIWMAPPPSLDRYSTVYEAALAKNIRLLNTPAQHALAQSFDGAAAKLQGLLPAAALTWEAVRKQAKLRHSQMDPDGLPLGRIFRVLLYRQTILTYGYFWEADDPLKWLTVQDEEEIAAIALAAAQRLEVAFLAIDTAQQTDETWTITGIHDAQFAGTPQIPWLHFWYELEQLQ